MPTSQPTQPYVGSSATFFVWSATKTLIARWLALKPRVSLLDEPTRGVDIEAQFEICRILAETGIGIVLISSELAELEHLYDRDVKG